jgi:threonine/homoserine/homoserine lactone efflux protein
VGLAIVTGFGLGFFIAAQVGPIWLLSARTVLRGAPLSGLAIGAAAGLVDVVYATLGVAGAGRLLEIGPAETVFGLFGAAVLLYLGSRNLVNAVRIRQGLETDDEVLRPWPAFRTALVAMASNPQTIAYWAAVFTAASTSDVTSSAGRITAMLVAVAIGTFTWNALQTGALVVIGRRLPDQALRVVDGVAAVGIIGFGGLLGVKTLRSR